MPKDSITIRLQSDLIDSLEAEAEAEGVSRSEYIRQVLYSRNETDELREEIDTLQQRLEDRENRITELEDQLAKRSQIEEKGDTLAKRVDDDEPDPPWPVQWVR